MRYGNTEARSLFANRRWLHAKKPRLRWSSKRVRYWCIRTTTTPLSPVKARRLWKCSLRQPDLDLIIAPVGGGGLLSGTALCAKALQPRILVWAGEPSGADDAYRSWKSGQWQPSQDPHTIADGLLTSLGQRNFDVIRKLVDEIICVDDDEIVRSVQLLYQAADLVVEPSGAVPLAALLRRRQDLRGLKLGVILSGGNFDIGQLLDVE